MNRLICAAAVVAIVFSSSLASAADVTEQQWVRVAENGNVRGRVVVPRSGGISAARGAQVSLLDQQGHPVVEGVNSDNTGRFVLGKVSPGVYTLMIQGDNVFACCAMHVVRSEVPIRDEFEIAAGAVDYGVVKGVLVRYLPPVRNNDIVFNPSDNPLATDRALTGEVMRVRQFQGGLKGRLTRAGFTEDLGAKFTNVLIYRDGVEVARTVTDDQGDFLIAELAPGSYSVLGSGKDGFGLMGLELIDPLTIKTVVRETNIDTTYVVQPDEIPEMFVMQIAPGPMTVIDDRLVEEREIGPAVPLDSTAGIPVDGGVPMSGGGFSGGGGGAGGGIAGGRGIGPALLIGGLGAVAISLAADDDPIVNPPVISPVTP